MNKIELELKGITNNTPKKSGNEISKGITKRNYSHEGIPKRCCEYCRKEVYVIYWNKHIKPCKKKHAHKIKSIDYIECPICSKRLKEINNDHLRLHGLTCEIFDKKFPKFDRLSIRSRKRKNTLKNLTQEISKKIKFGHKLEGYIQKHGEKEGNRLFKLQKTRKRVSRTLRGYIKRYGEEKGTQLYKSHNSLRGFSLENCIKKYGKIKGTSIYEQYCENRKTLTSLDHYIKLHGEIDGTNIWLTKNKKISKENRRIPLKDIKEFKKYCVLVDKYTRLSLQKFGLKKLNLRSKKYHLDHMISKVYGFKNKILPKVIGSIHNLKIITCHENCSKKEKCSIDLEYLTNKVKRNDFYKKFNIY